jgi:hypothetical protein
VYDFQTANGLIVSDKFVVGNCRCVVIAVDSAPDKSARVAAWVAKISRMDRAEAAFARQLRSVFRAQGEQLIAAIARAGA